MSVLNGPGEGTWSVFAMKVVEERDAAREALANSDACWRMEQEFLQRKLAGEAAHIKSLEGLLVDAVRERDGAKAEAERMRDERDYWERRFEYADTHLSEAFNLSPMDNLSSGEAKRIVDLLRTERDEARDELAKTSADFHDVWESRDKVIEERERARQACNAYWHDLTRIALLCAQNDDEYPLKAVERTVREFAQSRRDFVRVADALGLVSTDDTGRVGAIASVEDIVAHARHAAKALSREQPDPEEER